MVPWSVVCIFKICMKKRKQEKVYTDPSKKMVWNMMGIFGGIVFIIVTFMVVYACIKSSYTPDFGSLFGGVIGGGATLWTIALTIENEKNVRNEERSNSVRPIISAYQNNATVKDKECTYEYECWCNDNGYLAVGCYKNNCRIKREDVRKLIIKNIGCGPIIDLKISVIGRTIYKSENKKNLGVGETANISLCMDSHCMIVDGKQDGNQIRFEFKDIYGKNYSQSLKYGLTFKEDGKIELMEFGEISMENI